jgi:hypothetical protein
MRSALRISGMKVFSATMRPQRDQLGDVVTAWMSAHRELTIIDITVVQSSDDGYHCVTLVVAYHDPRTVR